MELQAATIVGGEAHFFAGRHFLAFDFDQDRVVRCGRVDEHDWGRLPGNLDAAVEHNGRTYFFRGDRYYRTPVGGKRVGAARDVGQDGWHSLPTNEGRFDAALAHPTKGKLYFFIGDRYWRWDVATDQVDKEGARIGVDGWFGVPADLDAALVHPNGKAYFFKGGRYHRYDFTSDSVDAVRDIGLDGWKGLDQWPQMVELNVAGENRRAMVIDRWSNDPCQPRPVVYYFHGNSGDAYDSYDKRAFHQLWPEAVVVYAEGTDVNSHGKVDHNGDLAWQVRFPYKFRLGYTKDIEYVIGLTRLVADRYPIAPEASFACGHSSGGFFTLSMMDILPHLFDGFAALGCHARYKVELNVPGEMLRNRAMPLQLDPDEVSARPRPVLYMLGKHDDSVGDDWPRSMPWWLPDASNATQKTMSTIRQLQTRNRCVPKVITDVEWSTPDTVSTIQALQHGSPVSWVMYDGDHSWPDRANDWTIEHFKALAP